jgi:hypothetical protein
MLMTLAIVAEPAPLQANEDGVILVGRTRVILDTKVTQAPSRSDRIDRESSSIASGE